MEWETAWQLATEISDIMGGSTPRQHEQIASLIYNRSNWRFSSHFQKWQRCDLAQIPPRKESNENL